MTIPRGTVFLIDLGLRSDFLFWAASHFARRSVIRAVLATPPDLVDGASPQEQARVQEMLDRFLPIAPRRLGLINEAAVISTLPRYELERIAVPTLTIGVADDLFGTYDAARYTADHIPGARFVGYPSGGHLWVGHHQDVIDEIARFLQ